MVVAPAGKSSSNTLIDNTDRMPLDEWGVPAHWPLVHQSQNVRTQTTIWRKADEAESA